MVLSPTRSKAYQRGLGYFPQVAMVGTPFVSESARACQYNFDLFRTLGDAGPQNANEGSFEILRTPLAAAVSAAKSTSSVSRVVPATEKSSQATRPATKVTLACGCGFSVTAPRDHLSLLTDHRLPITGNFAPAKIPMVSVAAWDEASDLAQISA